MNSISSFFFLQLKDTFKINKCEIIFLDFISIEDKQKRR